MVIDRNALKILCLMLATDVGFIALHLAYTYGLIPVSMLPNPGPEAREALLSMFQLDRDRSYSEVFQYLKEGWIILLLGWLMFKRAFLPHVGWMLLFMFFLLDDSIGLHEHVGGMLVQLWSLPAVMGLRAQDLGELSFVAISGAIIMPLIALGYWFSSSRDRMLALRLSGAVALLVLCGVGADMAHEMLPGDQIWVVLEDGGEMFAISLALAFALAAALTPIRRTETATGQPGRPSSDNIAAYPSS